MCGRTVLYIVDVDHLADLTAARTAAATLGITAGWGYGNVARKLLQWTGVTERPALSAESLLLPTGWAYAFARPGTYDDLSLYDVQSCYYRLLTLLPSPLPLIAGNRLRFAALEAESKGRWRTVIDLVGAHKLLRNTLVGCMAGGPHRRVTLPNPDQYLPRRLREPWAGAGYWYQGLRRATVRRPGPLRTAALLIVRSGWELTQASAEWSRAVYANVDCVMSPVHEVPRPWLDAGLTVRLQARGPASITALNVYRVGDKHTVLWRPGRQELWPIEAPPPPAISWMRQWLRG